MKTYDIRITFIREILGTLCADPEVHKKYIAAELTKGNNAENEKRLAEELAALPAGEVATLPVTRFYRDPRGRPSLADYQVKGFLKEALETLLDVEDGQHKIGRRKLSPFTVKGLVDGHVFVSPRWLPLSEAGIPLATLTRPLRAQTMQGPRVALATSEVIPAGTVLEFQIRTLSDDWDAWLPKALEYGCLRGLGQWRNAGYGSFTYEILPEKK